jgi:hypothetical protein
MYLSNPKFKTCFAKDCEFFIRYVAPATGVVRVCVRGKLECQILIQLEFIYFS